MATRKEVAAAAGVSVRTVSNVVNGFRHVAPQTRVRVERAIDELGYRPSELARSLKTGRSGLVGLMLPMLDNPYFAEITRSLVQEGDRHELTVVIDQTDGDRRRELSWVRRANSGSLFDALILSPLAVQSSDLEALPRDTPIVLLGEDDFPDFDRVAVDSFASSKDVALHFASMGLKHFAAIGSERRATRDGTRILGTSAERLAGFRAGMQEAGIPVESLMVRTVAGFTRDEGRRAMHSLLDERQRPDAVFCFADPLALGAVRALNERRVPVPREIAVVGFDDVEDVRFATPSISSVQPDKAWIAREAINRLLLRLSGESVPPETLWAPYALVVRESSSL